MNQGTDVPRSSQRSVLWRAEVSGFELDTLAQNGWTGLVIAGRTVRAPPARRASGFPVVGGLAFDLFQDGEFVVVDGDLGTIELEGVEEVQVVTSFLVNATGHVLLLRRSAEVGSFQGRWAGVSGFLEDPTAEAQARREIREETGFDSPDLELLSAGPPVFARGGNRMFVVHPFRFHVRHEAVQLDWEHTEFAWVEPGDIAKRDTVPKLYDAWLAVAPGQPSGRRGNA